MEKQNKVLENILKWLGIVFSYICPAMVLFVSFVLENLLSTEVSPMTKIGVSGVFVLVVVLFLAIFLLNRFFDKKLQAIDHQIKIELDNSVKVQLIAKQSKLENLKDLFKSLIVLAVLVVITILVALLESKLLELRGTMVAICISFAVGTGCMEGWRRVVTNHETKNNENKIKNNNKE